MLLLLEQEIFQMAPYQSNIESGDFLPLYNLGQTLSYERIKKYLWHFCKLDPMQCLLTPDRDGIGWDIWVKRPVLSHYYKAN